MLFSALLLSACGQRASAPVTPTPSAVTAARPQLATGVYEVSFERVGASGLSATAQRRSSVGAQQLVAGPAQAGDFSFTRLAVSTFAVDKTRIRHVRATFQVTNNSAQTLYNLLFVPVAVGGGTPFSSLRYYDGTDASSKASSLTAVQGKNFDAQLGQAVPDSKSSVLLTNLDVSKVGQDGLKNYGWQVVPELKRNASAPVTFAVDLPMDPAGSAKDPFSFSLAFTAVVDAPELKSAVAQYQRAGNTLGNYTQFPVYSLSGGRSLPAYYDVLKADTATVCSDSAVNIRDVSSAAFPHRFRVEVRALGDHTLNVYAATSCPATGSSAAPVSTLVVRGVAPARTPLAAGDHHSLALTADGAVWAWGRNTEGELGNGGVIDSALPVKVSTLSNVLGVSAGADHSLALMADGTVQAWGYNASGQLGNGSAATANSALPVAVSTLNNVVAISAGDNHSLALKADGTVWAWGSNYDGQLGNATAALSSRLPLALPGLSDIVSVSAGGAHNLALGADGTLWAWGRNYEGQLGTGSFTAPVRGAAPVRSAALTNVVSVAASGAHSLALTADGTVRAWGSNASGELGDGTATDSSLPVMVSTLTNAVGIAGGTQHNLALTADGAVWAWGENYNGQLGNSSTVASAVPVKVSAPTNTLSFTAGGYHNLALGADGRLRAWGDNESGALGDGTVTDRTAPVQVSGLGPVASETP